MIQNTTNFIDTLQKEAKKQSSLSQTHIFPKRLDPIMALIGNYPWQTVLILSGLTAVVLEIIGWQVT